MPAPLFETFLFRVWLQKKVLKRDVRLAQLDIGITAMVLAVYCGLILPMSLLFCRVIRACMHLLCLFFSSEREEK